MKYKILLLIYFIGFGIIPTFTTGIDFKNHKDYLNYGMNIPILSKGVATQKQMVNLILSKNKTIDEDIVNYIAKAYIQECKEEGINHDIAFSQMTLETNFLQFGHTVFAYQNNFAGIGTVSETEQGGEFNTIYMGVRAHIQHLLSYATKKYNPHNPIVDPRFSYVARGSAPLLKDLSGKWAADKDYSNKIFELIVRLVETPNKLKEPSVMAIEQKFISDDKENNDYNEDDNLNEEINPNKNIATDLWQ